MPFSPVTALLCFCALAFQLPTVVALHDNQELGSIKKDLVNDVKAESFTYGRNLQSSFVDPVWWQDIKDVSGKYLKRCKWQNNVAPEDASECRRMRIGDYVCMFEDQTCADGSTIPRTTCDCRIREGGFRTWNCEDYKGCETSALPATTCPTEHPVTFNPPLTCTGSLTCDIGVQTCCGETVPRYQCSCTEDGSFLCEDFICDSSGCPQSTQCPADTPQDKSVCSNL